MSTIYSVSAGEPCCPKCEAGVDTSLLTGLTGCKQIRCTCGALLEVEWELYVGVEEVVKLSGEDGA